MITDVSHHVSVRQWTFEHHRVLFEDQGNLLKGIDKKTVRREGIESIKRFLFSLTHFYQETKWFGIFQMETIYGQHCLYYLLYIKERIIIKLFV